MIAGSVCALSSRTRWQPGQAHKLIQLMNNQVILNAIANDAERGELKFSTNADVALRVRQALDDPDCHIEAATRLVKAEPLLAARVVAIANSVSFNRSGREITDVRAAVTRLGFQLVRTLATGLVAYQMASAAKNPAHRAMAMQLWKHSAQVASLAYAIAQRVTHQNPEAALFAGLVHEIGGFYLLSCAQEHPSLLDGNLLTGEDENERRIRAAVLNALAVPKPVVEAIDGLWEGYLAMPPVSLSDTLLLADWLAPIKSPLQPQDQPPSAEKKASVDMLIDQEMLSSIMRESVQEVASLTYALSF